MVGDGRRPVGRVRTGPRGRAGSVDRPRTGRPEADPERASLGRPGTRARTGTGQETAGSGPGRERGPADPAGNPAGSAPGTWGRVFRRYRLGRCSSRDDVTAGPPDPIGGLHHRRDRYLRRDQGVAGSTIAWDDFCACVRPGRAPRSPAPISAPDRYLRPHRGRPGPRLRRTAVGRFAVRHSATAHAATPPSRHPATPPRRHAVAPPPRQDARSPGFSPRVWTRRATTAGPTRRR
jgi:hypothetical protein